MIQSFVNCNVMLLDLAVQEAQLFQMDCRCMSWSTYCLQRRAVFRLCWQHCKVWWERKWQGSRGVYFGDVKILLQHSVTQCTIHQAVSKISSIFSLILTQF